MAKQKVYIGTAGWSIPSGFSEFFKPEGSHLERYASVFNAVEINSSFYREHQEKTYARWADAVPDDFQFSVKLSRYFTQEMRLKDSGPLLEETLNPIQGLGKKWGVLLIQLPPSLDFAKKDANRFFSKIRSLFGGEIACEPRHISWSEALPLFETLKISKVLADPERCPISQQKSSLVYMRLHGSPVVYKSSYEDDALKQYGNELEQSKSRKRWCIFDNTTFGFATKNAVDLLALTKTF